MKAYKVELLIVDSENVGEHEIRFSLQNVRYLYPYLRSRSRWSQELENELIRLYNAGTPPNICEFGHNTH